MEIRKVITTGTFLTILASSVVSAECEAIETNNLLEITSSCVALDDRIDYEAHNQDTSTYIYFECSTGMIKVHIESKNPMLDELFVEDSTLRILGTSYLEELGEKIADSKDVKGLEVIVHASTGEFLNEHGIVYE